MDAAIPRDDRDSDEQAAYAAAAWLQRANRSGGSLDGLSYVCLHFFVNEEVIVYLNSLSVFDSMVVSGGTLQTTNGLITFLGLIIIVCRKEVPAGSKLISCSNMPTVGSL